MGNRHCVWSAKSTVTVALQPDSVSRTITTTARTSGLPRVANVYIFIVEHFTVSMSEAAP